RKASGFTGAMEQLCSWHSELLMQTSTLALYFCRRAVGLPHQSVSVRPCHYSVMLPIVLGLVIFTFRCEFMGVFFPVLTIKVFDVQFFRFGVKTVHVDVNPVGI